MFGILEELVERLTIISIDVIELAVVTGLGCLFFGFVSGVGKKILSVFNYEVKKKAE